MSITDAAVIAASRANSAFRLGLPGSSSVAFLAYPVDLVIKVHGDALLFFTVEAGIAA